MTDPKAKAQNVVDAIIEDLCDRKGFDSMWDSLDIDTQREIETAWVGIVERALEEP